MVKIAICLFGNLCQKTRGSVRSQKILEKGVTENSLINEDDNWENPQLGYNHLYNKFIKKYDTDIFIHSWNIEKQYLLNQSYNPKKSLYEKQISFPTNLENYNIENNHNINQWNISDSAKMGYNLMYQGRNIKNWKQTTEELKIEAFRTSSRWYSTKKSIELKTQYENENNFKYDFVILCRFDSHWNFHYDPDLNVLNNEYIYAQTRSPRPDHKYTMGDLWFIGNSNNMNYFGTLYDNRYKYCIRPPFSSREHIQNNNIKLKLI